jgi:hypothetical protein
MTRLALLALVLLAACGRTITGPSYTYCTPLTATVADTTVAGVRGTYYCPNGPQRVQRPY